MARSKYGHKHKVTVVLPKRIIDELDTVSDDTDMARSDVIEMILRDTLEDEEKLDDLFGEAEDEEGAKEGEERE